MRKNGENFSTKKRVTLRSQHTSRIDAQRSTVGVRKMQTRNNELKFTIK